MNESSKDSFLLLILAVIVGPPVLINLLKPVQAFLVQNKVLVTENVLVPIGAGSGLDITRTVIAACILGALLLVGSLIAKSRLAGKDGGKK